MSARRLRRRYDLADNIRATIHAEVIVFGTLEIGPFRGDVVMRAFEDTGSHLPIYPQGHRLSFCHSRTLAQPRRCREVNMKMPAAVSDSRRRIPRYAARCAAREQRGAFLFRAGGKDQWNGGKQALVVLELLPAVEATINPGGYHGNRPYPRPLRRHLRSGGGSDFVVSL